MFKLDFINCSPEFMALATDFLRQWRDDNDYITAHTSGSTGKPKEIKLLKSDMMASARATNRRFDIRHSSTLLCPLSASYIAGKMMIVRAIVANCQVWFTTPSNRFWQDESIQNFILDTKPQLLSVVPSQVAENLSRSDNYADLLKTIGAIIVGGAPLDADTESALANLAPNCFATYGMTETCSHVAIRSLGIKTYTAMPGISFSTDFRGCLRIEAPEFSFKSLQTNDIVDLLHDDSFIWRGRFDNVINSGGIKIFPEEMEAKLAEHFPYPFYFKGIPHEKWGEAVEMITAAPASVVSDDEILSICRTHLSPYAIPSLIRRLTQLPLTATGKLLRR